MKNLRIGLLLFASLFMILSCAQGKRGSGVLKKDVRTVNADFDKISVSGAFNVFVKQGKTSGKVELEADDNLLQEIVVENVNNTLKVRFKTDAWLSKYKTLNVYVTASDLSALTVSGSGELLQDGTNQVKEFKATVSGSGKIKSYANADKVNMTLSGSGDIEMAGSAHYVTATVSGSGDIMAGKLKADHATATVSGSADVVVHATEDASGTVSGSGDIVIMGNPKDIKKRVSGSGSVSKG